MTIKKFLTGCIFFITLAVLSGCSTLFVADNQEQVEETDYGCAYFYFLWGRQAELAMQFEEALEAYQKALICDPAADQVARKIPILLLRLDRGDEAVSTLESYLENSPEDTVTRMLLARVYIQLGEYSEAEKQYRMVHELDPSDITSLLLLSELHLNQNMLANAAQVLREVLEVDPESYAALVLLARIYLNTARYDDAEEQYNKALELNWSVDLLMEKADVYRAREEFDKVVALYREILEKDRNNERAALALVNQLLQVDRDEEALDELNKLKERKNLTGRVELSVARLFARLEKYDQAIELLRNSLEREGAADVRYLLAVILAQAEKYEQALVELQLIGSDEPEFENGVMLQVRVLRYLGRQEEAVELLEKIVTDEQTRSPDLFVMLAALYHVQKKTELGESTFDRAIAAFPENDDLLYDYGLFLETAGRSDEAMSIMQEVIKRQPAHGEALNYVGYSWADKNIHLDQALEYIQRAIELKPDNAYIQDSLGWVYYRLGRIEEAREALERAVELSDEEDPAILDHLGDVYLELGRRGDAIDAYLKALAALEDDDQESELRDVLREKLQLLQSRE
ncbi:MAG: tetratricopeptide repeat protein [Desulfobulbaceae bacterium]|nr:tetratricopeptide repeat protein [Desulfobulbaceae bacterium]